MSNEAAGIIDITGSIGLIWFPANTEMLTVVINSFFKITFSIFLRCNSTICEVGELLINLASATTKIKKRGSSQHK